MERRNHRTPFKAEGRFLVDTNDRPVAACETENLAHFLSVTANYFDRLSKAARVCLGEYSQMEHPESYPGYVELKRLVTEYENDLRG